MEPRRLTVSSGVDIIKDYDGPLLPSYVAITPHKIDEYKTLLYGIHSKGENGYLPYLPPIATRTS